MQPPNLPLNPPIIQLFFMLVTVLFCPPSVSICIVTLHTCARDKVIGFVVVVMDTKIAKSGDLGT